MKERRFAYSYKGPLIIYAGGAGKNGGGGHANFRTVRGRVMTKLAYKRGGLSDFTILFYFKEMC